ncbi:hypothetical protein SDC9_189331 [bioreactor metagenome]|uniref:Uncharacterized protein n=1 Tax=bioreactor metagenome TaxID=1076179 RepID=A0A645HT79_9ZZZZ
MLSDLSDDFAVIHIVFLIGYGNHFRIKAPDLVEGGYQILRERGQAAFSGGICT